MVRRMTTMLTAALLALGAVAAPAAADEPSDDFVIDTFASDVTVREDGSLAITESIRVDFAEEPHHGIFRGIPLRYPADADDVPDDAPADRGPEDYWRVVEIDDVTVSATAPADLQRDTEDGALVLRIGDEDTEVTGVQTYEIAYTVTGAIDREGDAAVVRWNATGSQWQVPMRQVAATVTAPAEVVEASCAVGETGSTQPCMRATTSGDTASYAAQNLAPGEQLTVLASVPADSVAVPPPTVTERFRLSRALVGNPLAWPLAAAVAIAAFAALAVMLRRGRDRPAPQGLTGAVRYDPPEGVSPAELSVLLDEKVDQRALSATLVDLAERGFLAIDEEPGDGGPGDGGPGDEGPGDDGDDRDWLLRERDEGDASGLRTYERTLLRALFADRDQARLSDLRGEFHETYSEFRGDVYATAVARGWFPRNPAKVRAVWLGVSLAALAVSVGLLVAALLLTEIAVAAIPLVLAAIVFVALHWVMPHRTAEGSRLKAEADAYREGLRAQQGAGGGAWGDADPRTVFARNLPYAVALGAVPALVERMRRAGAPVQTWAPYWYGHPAGYAIWASDPNRLSTDLSSLADQVGGGLAHSPSSSGSGGAGVSAGGGFGGGGGGGW